MSRSRSTPSRDARRKPNDAIGICCLRTLSTTSACSLRQPPPAATVGASAALSSAREVIPSFGKTL